MADYYKLRFSFAKLMINPCLIAAAFLLFIACTAFAGVITFEKEYTYPANLIDNKISCRTIAMEHIKRLLWEELGTYFETKTEGKNFQLTKDQITILTAGIVRAEVIDEKWDGKTYYLKAKISVDPDEAAKSTDALRKEHYIRKEIEETRRKAVEFLKEIEKLNMEMGTVVNKSELITDTERNRQYNNAVKGLSATDWFEKGYALGISGRYQESIDAFKQAVWIKPDYAEAHYNLGTVYSSLDRHQEAIEAYRQAIKIKPDYAEAHNNLGTVYSNLDRHQEAMEAYRQAIKIKPDYAEPHYNLGLAWLHLNNRNSAAEEYKILENLNTELANKLLNLI